MFREYLTNKYVLTAIGFLILLSVACVLWYHYDTAPDKQQLVQDQEMLRQHEASKTVKIDTETKLTSDQTSTDKIMPSVEKSIDGALSAVTNSEKNTEKSYNNSELTESADETEIRVSPYGFGPYPYVPQSFIDAIGKPFWFMPEEILRNSGKPPSRDVELMQRVMVKLWKQGRTDVEAAFMDGDKVIVHYKNRAYVRYKSYKDANGENARYISSWRASSVPSPKAKYRSIYPPGEKDVNPNVELIDLDRDDVRIDPYEFLGLN